MIAVDVQVKFGVEAQGLATNAAWRGPGHRKIFEFWSWNCMFSCTAMHLFI